MYQWVRDPETGRKSPEMRPEAEWIRMKHPELRIIQQPLWDRIQQRRKALRQTRRRQPNRAHRQLIEIEQDIQNIVKAIKAGIFTPTTKAELEKAEAERSRRQQPPEDDTILTMLPRAKKRYKEVVDGIGALSAKHVGQAREQMRTLVGDIWLKPTREGHLEATLTGRYEGLLKLLGGKLNRGGCGERI